jgi:hypothetical protein
LDEVQHKKEDTEFIRQLNIHQLNIPQIQWGGNRMTPISFRTVVSCTLCPLQAGIQSRQRRVGGRH